MTADRVPVETRGGESPDDWEIAEAAKRAAAALEEFTAQFRDAENNHQGEE